MNKSALEELASRREARILEAANRLAGRMGCVFVKDERWPQLSAALRTLAKEKGE